MRKVILLSLLIFSTALMAVAGSKDSGKTTLKDFQPAGTTEKGHKHQQYDLSFASAATQYTCRSNEGDKLKATDWVVGSDVSYEVNGTKGKVKTAAGKQVKCIVVRVAPVSATP